MDHNIDWEEHWGNIFKPVHIIGWWNETDSYVDGYIFIMEYITDTQNPGSEYMYIRNRNVYYEWVRMCHWTVLLIKINTFNLITPIFTVSCNGFTCIITVSLLNTCSNEQT